MDFLKKRHFRIYILKNTFPDVDLLLYQELKKSSIKIKLYHVYDFFEINKKLLYECIKKFLIDPVIDKFFYKKTTINPCFEYISKKNNDRTIAAMQCIKILDPNSNVIVKTRSLIEFIGSTSNKNINYINKCFPYLFLDFNWKHWDNEENVIKKVIKNKNVNTKYFSTIKKFNSFSIKKIKKIHKECNLSISINDLIFIKKYFNKEKKNPTKLELKILDAFWSDHCRHTTFYTQLINISFKGYLKSIYKKIFTRYLKDKNFIKQSNNPITLMDLSKLPSKVLYKKGKLKHYVLSYENNASIITTDVVYKNSLKKEKWYLFFKNETHNFPTEIDPFNGAYTCIGGAIRDPLSCRSYVFQGIRISGSANPKKSKIINGKLSQEKICFESACGYSSYGNQIGIATTHINEIYNKGYQAKRMEVGVVVGAAPKTFVKYEDPKNGDIVLLIGGLTGKDGVDGATNSSKIIDNEKCNIKNSQSIGNPLIERKIQRFFRKKEVSFLIKKCNDLGAGGAAVALSEIHDSIIVHLDKIPIKSNEILTPLDIALSESQERMIVILDPKNVKKFINLSNKENIISVPIAKITDNKKIIFFYKKKVCFNIKSKFLNTRGTKKKNKVIVESPVYISPFKKSKKIFFNERNFLNNLSNLNISSQISLSEMFDSTVGGTTVLMPFGGRYQMTPTEGSVQKIPVFNGSTNTVSIVSWGYHPEVSIWSPFHGGAYSIVECISKIVSMGGDYKNIYFSFQEYYKKLGNDPKKWGVPFSSLLGAYHAQMSLGLACIGGKDSMSGTYKNLHVPPTLIAFGISTNVSSNIISPEFKKVGNKIYLYNHSPLKNEIPNFKSIKNVYNQIYDGIRSGKIVSAKTIKDGGISVAIAKMSFGNFLGADINFNGSLFEIKIGSIIVESNSTLSNDFILLGEVIQKKYIIFNKVSISIEKSVYKWLNTPLKHIYSRNEKKSNNYNLGSCKNLFFLQKKNNKIVKKYKHVFSTKKAAPRVFIPIFPGTNGEFESIRVFKKEGARINTFVFNNMNNKNITESINLFTKYINSVQIIMFCGGFSYGDEPDGAAKFIVSVLHNSYIKDAIERFIKNDGLILGICNGFQGLIKSGLLPYGKICLRNSYSPTIMYNKIKKHISQCVYIKIISDKSPWLNGMKNKIYILPISHGEGKFYANKKTIKTLFKKNQIASQYVDRNGNPSLNRIYNPNGSSYSIEGVLSNNGKIYGMMTHPERCFDNQLLKNIPDVCEYPIFKNSVKYFL